ncbi:MAG: ATP-dependent zinc protease [Arcobacter sp.]|jgi:hypothetical protein|uniref:ATP-dependent zinc protease n=1 Tax=Arcobacter defluvii TaxID=873191 RepID=A0AAE7BFV4_9BACT|nr:MULTISPECIES: RimK/LysX family protein [Arcobacter]MDY3200148.1 RimK/LysX family protein [Arcobacter sp.]QKF78760.1 putative ATP-dependent zinc protease [Arcobacter defluvii]RXI33930.1 clan AA aspartic protease [Arcobacter defluvii]BAK74534.1 conserved hypothetical protein [Arcobacter sp. L]
MSQKKVIGRREIVDILDLELFDLDAKIDTGADSNSLHCDDIFIDNDNKFVYFTLLDKVHPAYHGKKIKMPLYKIKKVKSSNGIIQLRATIQVSVSFFGKKYKTDISLTDRSDMKYPMLIGRKFLANRFLVDVSKEYLTKAI